ncbi:MAG: CRS1 / YhbY (CRM) domain protein [Promethearchaeota archaeon]|nr:MAG: CRS1 / YhbY (CRM) domain protein [Candidatus Lokiarchaeota archaeon]
MDYKSLFRDVLLNKPHCILGKKGVDNNKGFFDHIQTLLKQHKIIKIKLLKTALHGNTIKELATLIAEKSNANLLDLRGRMLILSKKNIKIK